MCTALVSWTPPRTKNSEMLITIAATVAVVSVAVVPAAAELHRMLTEDDNPMRKLKVKTRRAQVDERNPTGAA